jgi:chemotaxis protein MotA
MDIAAFLGLIIGVGAIIVGNIVKGGTTAYLIQLAAALIVFGGTLGATLMSFSMKDMFNAVKSLRLVFGGKSNESSAIIEDILRILAKARRMGLIALEPEIKNIENHFLRKGLTLVVDGMPPSMIKDVLYQEIATYEENMKNAADVFGAAGGYAPTIGILGAVLGLIQAMGHIADPAKIGGGIALAFVATIYGIGSANLIFLPMARKIMNKVKEEVFIRELIIEGIIGVESGVNPYFLKARLNAFLSEHEKSE